LFVEEAALGIDRSTRPATPKVKIKNIAQLETHDDEVDQQPMKPRPDTRECPTGYLAKARSSSESKTKLI
jgi:hypothetical protein